MVSDVTSLSFSKSSFYLIIIEYLLGLLDEPKEFLRSLPSLLKRNGILIIADEHGLYERMIPLKRMISPKVIDEALEEGNKFEKECEFDTPYFEILTDRVVHMNMTSFVKYRKKEEA